MLNRREDEDELGFAMPGGSMAQPAPLPTAPEPDLEQEFEAQPEQKPRSTSDFLAALTKKQQAADENKAYLGVAGNVLQNFANVPSAYELLKGKSTGPAADIKGTLAAAAQGIRDPMQDFKRKYETVNQAKAIAADASERDPNSKASMALKALAPRWGIQVTPDMSAYDIKQMIDPKKMMETEAISRAKFDNDVELEKLRQKGDLMKFRNEQGVKKAEKDALAAKLDDKHVAAITDFDTAESDLSNMLAQLGNHSDWTGPLDGAAPDMAISDDQVAWRSNLGKFKDAYRKAITGAGAGPREIAMLEKRLPSEYDTYDNFKAKATEAINALRRHKGVYLGNLKKAGKDVAQYEGSPGESPRTMQASAPDTSGSSLKLAIQEEKARRAKMKNTAGN